MFSEFYFCLTAFLEDKTDFDNPDDIVPTIYRIYRIRSFTVLDERFRVPYSTRFQEGEFRKRVQFMFGGKLQTVRFTYSGPSVEKLTFLRDRAKIGSSGGFLVSLPGNGMYGFYLNVFLFKTCKLVFQSVVLQFLFLSPQKASGFLAPNTLNNTSYINVFPTLCGLAVNRNLLSIPISLTQQFSQQLSYSVLFGFAGI